MAIFNKKTGLTFTFKLTENERNKLVGYFKKEQDFSKTMGLREMTMTHFYKTLILKCIDNDIKIIDCQGGSKCVN